MKTFQVLYLAETEIFIKLQPEGVSNFRQNDTDATTMNGKIIILGKFGEYGFILLKKIVKTLQVIYLAETEIF